MSYYGGFYKMSSLKTFSLHRTESTESMSAPLFKEQPFQDVTMGVKSYGGVDLQKLPRNGHTLGKRLEKRHTLIEIRRLFVDIVCALALIGILLMMIETELFIYKYVDKTDMTSFTFKIFISISTFFLLVGICFTYYVEVQIKALDAGVKDWHSVISNSTWFCLFAELFVCSLHPFPGDMKLMYTSPTGESKKVSADAVLSILMMARLYLIAKFCVVHSRLLTDTSTSSIGALSKIKINTMFVFKAAMTNTPTYLLLSVMGTTFLVNSWAMRTCEIYYQDDNQTNTYMEVMWLIATTFLTVGYGDKIPQSYCGRYISICTGVMGVGTTALLVALCARKLEQSRSERYVFNMVTRIQIEKRRKNAAADVIKSVIKLWMIMKYNAQEKYSKVDKQLRRKYWDQLKNSIRQLRIARIEKAHVNEFNVGIIEVSETVNRVSDSLARVEMKQEMAEYKHAAFESRLTNIESKLDEIRTMLAVKR